MKKNLFDRNLKIEITTDNKKLTVKEDKIIIAGPCAIESYDQLLKTAKFVKSKGANILRGGAYKPRTSPNSFQGLKEEGLEILKAVKKETGMAVITELMDIRELDKLYEVTDIIQIGSRNMQNFNLLTEVGKQDKPVMLKRGLSATIGEWIGAAEYIAVEGNSKIIMCERGIRTYNDYTRNTLDLAAVPIIQKETGLPVVVDPSHGTGVRYLIKPMSIGAFAVGADGIMVEVHPEPENALSDGMQSLNFSEFEDLINSIYSNEDRMAIWQYKYLEYPIEKFTKSQREQIEAYLKEEENGLHQSKMYTETFYQQHEHNSIEYDVNKKVDEYIKEDNETTDFTMVDSEQYQIQSGGFFKRRKNRLLNERNDIAQFENTSCNENKENEIVVRNQILKY